MGCLGQPACPQFDVSAECPSDVMRCESGNVTYIRIYGVQRTAGPLPPSVGQLSSLTELDLHNSSLVGDLPAELWTLTSLLALNLAANGMAATIASSIGALTNLRSLQLWNNAMFSSLPTQIGLLTSLTQLLADNNLFDSTLPSEIALCTALKALFLHGNGITGVPTQFWGMQSIEAFDLSFNQFDAAPFPELSAMPQLVYVGLANIRLFGTVPASIASLTALEFLAVHTNNLEGDLAFVEQLSTRLTYLSLGGNKLAGPVPDLTRFTLLQTLYLDFNNLTVAPAAVPATLTTCKIGDNCFACPTEGAIACDCATTKVCDVVVATDAPTTTAATNATTSRANTTAAPLASPSGGSDITIAAAAGGAGGAVVLIAVVVVVVLVCRARRRRSRDSIEVPSTYSSNHLSFSTVPSTYQAAPSVKEIAPLENVYIDGSELMQRT